MRIVIDLQGAQCGSRHRGIGRYSLALTQALLRLRGEHEIHVLLNGLFADTISPLRDALAPMVGGDRIHVWQAAGPVASADPQNDLRRKLAELAREAAIAALQPDWVLVTSFLEGFGDDAAASIGRLPSGAATAAIFYDAIPLVESDKYLKPNPALESAYRRKIDFLGRADLLLAISESSRQEAITHLGIAPERVVYIGAAADRIFSPQPVPPEAAARLKSRFGITRGFVLCSGAADPRKNHVRLLNAFARLEPQVRARHQLVMAGEVPGSHRQAMDRHMRECGLQPGEVVWTGRVTDGELQQLYSLCTLFVFPSWHEGFGLPALEAMSCGAPVIGANTTSVPEVIGVDWALFDPFDEAAIAARMEEFLTQPALRERMVAHGLQRSRDFSWDSCAARAITAMETASRPLPSARGQVEARQLAAQLDEVSACLARQDSQLRVGTYRVSVRAAARMLGRALRREYATAHRKLKRRLGF